MCTAPDHMPAQAWQPSLSRLDAYLGIMQVRDAHHGRQFFTHEKVNISKKIKIIQMRTSTLQATLAARSSGWRGPTTGQGRTRSSADRPSLSRWRTSTSTRPHAASMRSSMEWIPGRATSQAGGMPTPRTESRGSRHCLSLCFRPRHHPVNPPHQTPFRFGGGVDAFNGTVRVADGRTIELIRRERPELLHDEVRVCHLCLSMCECPCVRGCVCVCVSDWLVG